MNPLTLRTILRYLEEAREDLHILERAGVDTGFPQSRIQLAIDTLEEELDG